MAKTDWKDIDGVVASVGENRGKSVTYTVVFTYVVDGHWCAGTFTSDEAYRVGDTLPVRYDAKDPDRNDLSVNDRRKHWLIGIIVAVFFLIIFLVRFFT